MKVAIVTSGILPVPPIKGGAVENLVKFYLDYNEIRSGDIQFTVFSVYDNNISSKSLQEYKKTKFVFIKTHTYISKLRQFLLKWTKRNLYYHHSWEYFALKVSDRIRKDNFDVVVVENRPGFIFSLSNCSEAIFILHLHNDMLNRDTLFSSEILNSYASVLVVSKYIKQRVNSILPTDKVHVLYNGIELENFREVHKSDITRKNFNLSEDDFVVVYTGRIEAVKGIKELLDAFSYLINYEKIKLLIVGGGNRNIDESDFFLEMKNLSSSMLGKINFIGFQSYENIPAILNLCDIAVVPSIWEEPLSLTSLEDMATGLPLVVTRSGGIPEIVNEKCAIMIEKDDALSLNISKAILDLYHNEDKRRSMSEQAKIRSALFSKEKYALSFLEYIEQMLCP
ncbi:glycosyltransferase family 4 protein [uncultured Bacteroides sp.]|uniref:glycosyltransferase family 4 protein n=1 Tax=uncultured Bacteroides sp. TaxID=162156 RepID=UPI002AABE7D9|nr:glycosyltransferase family 4 protein [uncultured Bacteroides sp.]